MYWHRSLKEARTSLSVLIRKTRPGHELSVQVINLCVLAEQQLLEAADLDLQVTHRATLQLKTLSGAGRENNKRETSNHGQIVSVHTSLGTPLTTKTKITHLLTLLHRQKHICVTYVLHTRSIRRGDRKTRKLFHTRVVYNHHNTSPITANEP